jgi:hypothetical protein
VTDSSRRARKKAQVDETRQALVDPDARPTGGRVPLKARTFNPTNSTGTVVVRFGRFDVGGQWCLSKITPDAMQKLLARIRDIETMTITEAFNNRDEPGKDYPIAELPSREARERLVELEYDDEDRISRLRVTSRGRLYGFRRDAQFYALWWDPEHEIYPSTKKHT